MRVHYVSGSRADFGLMEACLHALESARDIEVCVVLTGQHLLPRYGQTETEVVDAGFQVVERIKVDLTGGDGSEMGFALSEQLAGFLRFWERDRPDLVLVLGDRGEMLAATLAAVHLGIHVAHLHGGELSGTIDESFRHAISKLAHFHLATNEDARTRLIKMGEAPQRIWNVGAPGLVGIVKQAHNPADLYRETFELTWEGPKVMLCFHPVVQEAAHAADQVAEILSALAASHAFGILLRPNSDAGGAGVDRVIDDFVAQADANRFIVVEHLRRDRYLQCLAQSDVLVGNSSSGIIESASLAVPCLNLGSRQNGRLRNENVIDCADITKEAVTSAFQRTLRLKGPFVNSFGQGDTDTKLAHLLPTLPLGSEVLSKLNSY